MERTDKQENNRRRDRQVFSTVVSSAAVSSAGAALSTCADGLLICGRNAFDVPERRCPGDPIAVGPDDVGFTDLDAAVYVRSIESMSVNTVIVFDNIDLARSIHAVFMRAAIAAPRLDGLFATDSGNFFVGIHLCHRSGTAVKPKEDNDSQNEQDGESRNVVFVTVKV